MNLNDLASFVRVVRMGTIAAAAKEEGVPRSTISRRIARLEDELGLELVRRAARSFSVTEDGMRLVSRSSPALHTLEVMEKSLHDRLEQPQGKLVISIFPELGRALSFADALMKFQGRYPEVQLEVRLEGALVDLLQEDVDIAIRAHGSLVPGGSGLMARTVGTYNAAFYASPSYIEQHGLPDSLHTLEEYTLISHTALETISLHSTSQEKEVSFSVPDSAMKISDFTLLQTLIEKGAGIALLPQFVTKEALEKKALKRVLPEWSTYTGRLSLVWPASQHLAPRVRLFIDHIVEHFAEQQTQPK